MSSMSDDWEDIPLESSVDDWEDVADVPVETSPSVDQSESALRGAIQGASLGFADELVGGAEALKESVLGDDKLFDILDNYEKYRDESRANFEAAQKANPNTYLAGELTGSLATALVPGVGMAKVASSVPKLGKLGASILGGAGAGAIQGAATGAGYSEAEDFSGVLQDTKDSAITGAALGSLAPLAGKGLSSAIKAGKNLASKSTTKALSALGDISEEAVDQTLKDPTKVKKAVGSTRQIVEDLKESTQSLLRESDTIANQGRSVLSSEPKLSIDPIVKNIEENVLEGFDTSGQALIKKALKDLEKSSQTVGDKLVTSEAALQNTLDDIYGIIYPKGLSNVTSLSSSKKNLSKLANEISQTIKASNPEYATAMNKASAGYSKVADISSVLGVDEDTAKLLARFSQEGADLSNLPESVRSLAFKLGKDDALVSKLDSSLTSPKEGFMRDLSTMAKGVGIEDFSERIKTEAAKKELTGTTSIKTGDVILGRGIASGLGAGLGYAQGGQQGALAGAAIGLAAKPLTRAALQRSNTVQAPFKAISKLMDAPNSVLTGLSTKMVGSNNKALRDMGEQLNYVMQQDDAVKKAYLWSLSQQPAFKEYVKRTQEEEDGQEE